MTLHCTVNYETACFVIPVPTRRDGNPELCRATRIPFFQNFLALCETAPDWDAKNIIGSMCEDLAGKIGNREVIIAYSGGVDSSVTAALLKKVRGEGLLCLTIDGGNFREGEVQEIQRNAWDLRCLHEVVYAAQEFLNALDGIVDAETKRKIFQSFYQTLLLRHARGIVADGTTQPDLIESGKTGGDVIKTHHNPGTASLNPLKGFFKDEVRDLARALGLPEYIVNRESFPGPGLFIRMPGLAVTQERLLLLRWADAQVRNIVSVHPIAGEISQLVVALLGIRVTGVGGDKRRYNYPIAVRAVKTIDYMTARGVRLPDEVMREINDMISAHEDLAYAVEVCVDKPPGTIEFE